MYMPPLSLAGGGRRVCERTFYQHYVSDDGHHGPLIRKERAFSPFSRIEGQEANVARNVRFKNLPVALRRILTCASLNRVCYSYSYLREAPGYRIFAFTTPKTYLA